MTTLRILFVLIFATVSFADDADTWILRPAPNALNRVLQRYGLKVLKGLPGQNIYLVQATDDDNDLAVRTQGDRDVQAVEKNEDQFSPEVPSGSTSPQPGPADQALSRRSTMNYFGDTVWTSYARQPAASLIGLPQAQSRNWTGAGTVAIIDSGVDPNHPVLRRVLLPGYDFTRDRSGASEYSDLDSQSAAALTQSTTAFLDSGQAIPVNDYSMAVLSQSTTAFLDAGKLPEGFGHGTMVAGLVHLVAPHARILPLKAFLADGRSNTFDILRAIYYASNQGARVINMSFNMKEPSAELSRAIAYAEARGAICVASAGNDGNEIIVYPAAYRSVLGIASTNAFDERSGFTNYGQDLVSLAAPGEGLITTYPGNTYAAVWGTSFSTALVSGSVALLLQQNPSLTWVLADGRLQTTAVLLQPELGAGRLNLRNW